MRLHAARFYSAAREKGLDAARIKPQHQRSGSQTVVEMYIASEAANVRPKLLATMAQGE